MRDYFCLVFEEKRSQIIISGEGESGIRPIAFAAFQKELKLGLGQLR